MTIERVIEAEEKNKVVVQKTGGAIETIEVKNPGREEREKEEKRKRKVAAAVLALLPITSQALSGYEEDVDAQSNFFNQLRSKAPKEYEDIDDIHQVYRLACSRLGNAGVDAYEAARRVGRTLQALDLMSNLQKLPETEMENLRNVIVSYYPRNFPKNKARPNRR